MNKGKCPRCEAIIETVKTEHIMSEASPDQQTLQGVSYLCPSCNTVLGTQMAHPSLQEEALKAV